MAYELCTFRLPFQNESIFALYEAIIKHPHHPITDKLYSDELKHLIDSLLTKDPLKRPSIQELTEVPIIKDAIAIF